jgi:hypothetical protein
MVEARTYFFAVNPAVPLPGAFVEHIGMLREAVPLPGG